MRDNLDDKVIAMFKNLSQEAQNALVVAAIGGAAAGAMSEYVIYRRSMYSQISTWFSNQWGEVLMFAITGALVASSVVYVLVVLRRA